MNQELLLKVENMKKYFMSRGNIVKAVDGVSFCINKGETYSLVGESGSGKSTIGRCVVGLYELTGGNVWFDGQEISEKLAKEQERKLHREVQMIFQDPMASLNPKKRVIDIIAQGLDEHKMYTSTKEREQMVYDMLQKVGLHEDCAWKYPYEFSGGQRQRIGIARALILNPKLVIADECISALDVSVQAQIINLMRDIQKELGCAYLFITHNLPMAQYISDRIGVLHLGHLVESGTKEEIFRNPIHPYTKCLLLSALKPNPITEKQKKLYFYNYDVSNLACSKRKFFKLNENHFVWSSQEELVKWMENYTTI